MKIAIIGAGISGLSAAHFLKEKHQVVVFEKEATPGGLIRCKRVDGCLYHLCGGHVFNSKRQDVLDWFWSKFDRQDWVKANRNAVVFMEDGKKIPYPIENHMYLFDSDIQKSFIQDLLLLSQYQENSPANFEEFLRNRFGDTLYNLYFKSYNEKVWRRDLKNVPLLWLEGKLPMPTVFEMIYNNMNHIEEKQFVHSTFWYEKQGGSQYIANTLAADLDIRYNSDVSEIMRSQQGWKICGIEFDAIVFCGNIKDMSTMVNGIDLKGYSEKIEKLEYHGTTSVFCEIEKNPYSWIYQPSKRHESHRIICTGNFASSNNIDGKMTGTVEFTDEISKGSILENLAKIPLSPKYLDHHYNKYTYPIQNDDTRHLIQNLKKYLAPMNFYFTGRFADWEYYNMDVSIGASMDLCSKLIAEYEN